MLRKKIKGQIGKSLLLGVFVFFLQFNTGCQRDDICPVSTQTTPMLIISFLDAADQETPKPPVNLTVRAVFYDTIIQARGNEALLRLPLRLDAQATEYEFILNAPETPEEGEEAPEDISNLDRITFSYTPEQIYINRACSFKVNFLNLNASLENDGNPWINTITVEEENIENETEPHIIIYH